MKYLAFFLLSIWLIASSLLSVTTLHFPYEKIVMPVIALIAGITLLLHVLKTKLGNIGLFLLSIWLILRSGLFIFNYSFPYDDMAIASLGIGAGFFLIIRK